MDIAFHYFAVKAIARAVGMDEDSAQRAAVYSQFIDDYNYFAYRRCGNIPDYLNDDALDIVVSSKLGYVNPVTTGFTDFYDMAALT